MVSGKAQLSDTISGGKDMTLTMAQNLTLNRLVSAVQSVKNSQERLAIKRMLCGRLVASVNCLVQTTSIHAKDDNSDSLDRVFNSMFDVIDNIIATTGYDVHLVVAKINDYIESRMVQGSV